MFGGEPADARRTIWGNFISSIQDRIQQAQSDWTTQRMGNTASGPECIPLP
jgi:redox-sensitive bicupin YhaK (pirin superfamily)